ncbi:Inositol-polyphosphate 5-phosphatase protein, partial [Dioscorea alata]
FSVLPRFFSARKGTEDPFSSVEFGGESPSSPISITSFSGKGMDYSDFPSFSDTQAIRIFVATWNVGGKPPHKGLNLNDLLPSDDQSDVYVLGFQEIVPLNAGNVLVIEDNEPATKWLGLINKALNKSSSTHDHNVSKFFQKPSLKSVRRSLRTVNKRQLKSCNCTNSSEVERKLYYKDSCFGCQQATLGSHSIEYSSEDEAVESNSFIVSDNIHQRFCLIACKQMVGIFVNVWVRRDMAQHVSHLRISCVSRGIMGYLGNKGCISVSMCLYQTRFCFVCSHLASGEKEGDELRRNSDVIETLKNTQFPRICKASSIRRMPDKILGHDRIIWLGDLNYRIALSYSETKKLLLDNNWDALFEKDQLKMERETWASV